MDLCCQKGKYEQRFLTGYLHCFNVRVEMFVKDLETVYLRWVAVACNQMVAIWA
jgi:hypothetical protein